ncbi:Uncharacterised protein [Sebaldella termitidis]|uniref:Tail sheath protein subtilisin-like domain-containing protein n=1 Tax=Sebaldella termitidis (strain ATCC 33386 / NCTC 11300) TaxID=526218 RepID=D1AN70_SEBTE|nr:hypothetical protein [Sebaldella termitidis]ACZ09674.1 hypothetical protein Sterm_2830 [Sebaldella termitidis ATCC 33386]SUI25006.1 Uncharacterised protein [Sebaldella termitidis]
MSRNRMVEITDVSTNVALTNRDFGATLLLVTNKAIDSDSLPYTITSLQELIDLGFTDTDLAYRYVIDFFGSNPKPSSLQIYGEVVSTTNTVEYVLSSLEQRAKDSFYFVALDDTKLDNLKSLDNFMKASKYTHYAVVSPSKDAAVADIIALQEELTSKRLLVLAYDKDYRADANLVGTKSSVLPYSTPMAEAVMTIPESSYSLTEINQMAGDDVERATGINVVTNEEGIVTTTYGKSVDGITWADNVIGADMIDEALRKGWTQALIERNATGKFDVRYGSAELNEIGRQIIQGFVTYDWLDNINGNPFSDGLGDLVVVVYSNRKIEYKTTLTFSGCIIAISNVLDINEKTSVS